jgi:hypothetical protein
VNVALQKAVINWIGFALVIRGASKKALRFLELSRQQVGFQRPSLKITLLSFLEKYYILVGTQEKLNPEASAMLVSDPIQCQEGVCLLEIFY